MLIGIGLVAWVYQIKTRVVLEGPMKREFLEFDRKLQFPLDLST